MEAVGSASKHGRLVAHPLLGLRVAGWRAWWLAVGSGQRVRKWPSTGLEGTPDAFSSWGWLAPVFKRLAGC